MLRLRSIFVGRVGHFCSVGQRTCRRTTLTAGDKWARLSGISCTTGPVCGAVGYDANSGSVIGTRRPRRNTAPGTSPGISAVPGGGSVTAAQGLPGRLLANPYLGQVAWHLCLFRQMRLAESKDGDEGLVDAPLLFWSHLAHEVTEASGVDGADLLNQDANGLPEQVNLRAERRGPGATRGWRDQDHRAW
jgi:hypothetical protein